MAKHVAIIIVDHSLVSEVKSVNLTKECMFATVAFLTEDDDI